jgi:hypothetical protein
MASGMFYNEEGQDVTMDVLSQAVEEMDDPRPEPCPRCGGEVHQAMTGIGDAPLSDITWPSCTECDWQGEP